MRQDMKKNSYMIKWLLGCLLIGIFSFFIGDSYGQRLMARAVSPEYNGVQAMLAFNRILDERHWEYLLSNGCAGQAKKALDVAQDKDLELLSGLLSKKIDPSTVKYINDRDSKLISQLRNFKSKYGNTWYEDKCP